MATLLEYKCPCCGGAIHFDSGKQQMACPYCDTTFDVSTLKAYDEELHNLQPEQMEWNTTAGNQWEIGEEGGLTFYWQQLPALIATILLWFRPGCRVFSNQILLYRSS